MTETATRMESVTAGRWPDRYSRWVEVECKPWGDAPPEQANSDWDRIAGPSIPGERIDAIADYLRSTGQASA